MITRSETRPSLRRAVLLMTGSSFLIPAAGVLTQPLLTQTLGAAGRGELTAVTAPAVLAISVATLGLPEALTFYLAKHPSITRRALAWATLVSTGLGGLCLIAAFFALPFLSTGDARLGNLIMLATALAVPVLVIGVFRGAATGRQMWGAVATERLINTVLRVLTLMALWLTGHLTVMSAVLAGCLAPVVAGVVYWQLLIGPPPDDEPPMADGWTLAPLVSFGSKVWLGAVAGMLLARIGQMLMAPLSNLEQLGLYTVATTISDVPLIVAMAISGAVYGINSKATDSAQVTLTARLTLLAGFVGCAVLGCTSPYWIAPLFGAEFAAATVPTLMLMGSALLCIPGLLAATGLGAWGRPGLRSIGYGVALVFNVTTFVILVPHLGAIGACWTSIMSNVVLSGYMVVAASRVMRVPARDFLLVRGRDITVARRECSRLVEHARRRFPAKA